VLFGFVPFVVFVLKDPGLPASKMKTVAIIGASTNRRKFGNKAVRAFRTRGYTVIPINPHETRVEGEPAFPSVLDYPGDIDEATLYVTPDVGLTVIEQIAKKGIKAVWLNPGADDGRIAARAEQLGVTPISRCSIAAIGESPGNY
jgi:uncharacterized protein